MVWIDDWSCAVSILLSLNNSTVTSTLLSQNLITIYPDAADYIPYHALSFDPVVVLPGSLAVNEAVENHISINLVKVTTDQFDWDALYINKTTN